MNKSVCHNIVTIYGYDSKYFLWKKNDSREVYHTSGLIIKIGGYKFILTTREKIISCQTIICYYYYESETEKQIMRNDLHIIYQSVYNNIILLASCKSDFFDCTKSVILTNTFNTTNCTTGIDFTNVDVRATIPKKNCNYYIVKSGLDLHDYNLIYNIDTHKSKFIDKVVWTESFVPAVLLYNFNLDIKQSKTGICGATVFDSKNRVIGIVCYKNSENLFVLSVCEIISIIKKFESGYVGSKNIYFPTTILTSKNSSVFFNDKSISNNNFLINSKNSKSNKKLSGYQLISVNDDKVKIVNGSVHVKDSIYRCFLPIDVYINTKFSLNDTVTMCVKKKSESEKIDFTPCAKKDIMISDVAEYNPISVIPFININGYIIVQLTHELLNVTLIHNIRISNKYIDKMFAGITVKHNKLIILDYIGNDINCPIANLTIDNFNDHELQNVTCPFIIKINGKKINSLSNLHKYIQVNSIHNIVYGTYDDNINEIIFEN